MKYDTDSVVVHCIDFRFQHYLDPWLHENLGHFNYDRVSLAGGIFDFEYVLKQIKISEELHDIEQIILINHENCGAYGSEGTYARHKADLISARDRLKILYPDMEIELYYLHLDGEFEAFLR